MRASHREDADPERHADSRGELAKPDACEAQCKMQASRLRMQEVTIRSLRRQRVVAIKAGGGSFGIAVATFQGTEYGPEYISFQAGDHVVKLPCSDGIGAE